MPASTPPSANALISPTDVASPTKKNVLGLTGAIGAGKSMVAEFCRQLGCAVINADELAAQVRDSAAGVEFVRQALGPQCVRDDGTLDRRAIADVIFTQPDKRTELEAFIYPRLHQLRETLTQAYHADPAVRAIVIESPLLYETGLQRFCDRVILVDADVTLRCHRVQTYRGWPEGELYRREKFFLPVHLKRSLADGIVYNNSTPDHCRRQMEDIFSRLNLL